MDFVNKSREEVITWLDARLKGEDGWNSRHLASYLHSDLLRHILSSYSGLEQYVRVKILLAMLEISTLVFERDRDQFSNLLSLARQDEDEWVSKLGMLVEHFLIQSLPASEIGSLLEGAESIVKKLRYKDLSRGTSSYSKPLLSPELTYLNYSVLNSLSLSPESYGVSTGGGHFRLKKKLRTSAIKDDILIKSKDQHKLDEDTHNHPTHSLSSGKSGDIFIPPTSSSRDKPHTSGYRASIKPPVPSMYHQKGHTPQSRSSTTKLLHMEDLASSASVAPAGKRKRKESLVTPLKLTDTDKGKRKKGSLTRYNSPPHPSRSTDLTEHHSSTDSPSPVPPPHHSKPSHKKLLKIQEKKHRFMEDMFAEADLLSEKQKQIIMDFMVGQATKPYLESGDKLTFTLNKTIHENDSEKTEVETLFEMDYSTKQWRKLKKSVVLKIPI
ncbi:hypothetical protein LOD99_12621 [Oopsacas minuta]|uniref:NELF-A N-terminal domain-containing protein n=1 Tax=Oopsacas minuta TaxID=111878 RepID=A0AAV7JCJ8_9METZ|nr:hypothetical protein LOD99_12621 [Oopsacas minuta]